MATTVISAVDPTGGGDYLTLDEWVLAKKGNLVTRDTIEVAEIYSGGSVGALNLLRGDWTVDSTHYPIIRAAVGHAHGGVWSATQAFIKAANPDDPYITIEVGYTRFGLGISAENNGNPGTGIQIGFGGAAVTPPILFEGAICRLNTGDPMVQLFQNNAGNPFTFRNCVFFKAGQQSIFDSSSSANVEALLYNSVLVYTSTGGFQRCVNFQAGTLTEQNNYFRAPTDCYDDGGGSGTINKGANTATSTTEAISAGLRSIPNDNTTFNGTAFLDGDYRIHDGSPLLDVGADLTASGVTVDFVGTSRPQGSAFDIGAHEFVPPAPVGGRSFFIFGW